MKLKEPQKKYLYLKLKDFNPGEVFAIENKEDSGFEYFMVTDQKQEKFGSKIYKGCVNLKDGSIDVLDREMEVIVCDIDAKVIKLMDDLSEDT